MDKNDLLRRFAEAYKNDGFPPLAGKIMGLFYISNEKYFYFEDIMHEVGASKGAVSKTLKLLIELNRVDFVYSKGKSRRRMFYMDIQGIKHFLRSVIINYKKQDQLLKECAQVRTNENEELNEFIGNSLQFNKEVLTFLDEKTEQYFK